MLRRAAGGGGGGRQAVLTQRHARRAGGHSSNGSLPPGCSVHCLPACPARVPAAQPPAAPALPGRGCAGFASGKLVGQLFRDVPDALAVWRNAGIKTYIYSSGSREAQRNFFGHTQARRAARGGGAWHGGRACGPGQVDARQGCCCHSPPHFPPLRPLLLQVGNLVPYLCGFFDTTSGPKVGGAHRRAQAGTPAPNLMPGMHSRPPCV